MKFWPPDDKHVCSKHVEAWNKRIVKQKICASSWLITEIYTEMHGQQNVKKKKNYPTVFLQSSFSHVQIYESWIYGGQRNLSRHRLKWMPLN